ncbi:hypothetical protein C8J56DRAFT_1069498 [Mycena floridula]|nr:hypothetical protein C8J56DRAFT_1069498 [Mycena floridula]
MEPPSVSISPDVASTLSEQLPGLLQFLQAHSAELAARQLGPGILSLQNLQAQLSPPVTVPHPRVLMETGLATPVPSPQKRKRTLAAPTLMDQVLSPTLPFITPDSRPSKKARAQSEPALSHSKLPDWLVPGVPLSSDSEDDDPELFVPSGSPGSPEADHHLTPASETSSLQSPSPEPEEPVYRNPHSSKSKGPGGRGGTRNSARTAGTLRLCVKKPPKNKSTLGTLKTSRIRAELQSEGKEVPSLGDVDEPALPSTNAVYMFLDILQFSTSHKALLRVRDLVDTLKIKLANLQELQQPSISWAGTTLQDLALRCSALESDKCVKEYAYLLSLVQFRLEIHRLETGRPSYLTKAQAGVDDHGLAAKANMKLNAFRLLKSKGSRLVHLCCAATPYILVVLAAVGCNTYLRTSSRDVITAVALELICERPLQKRPAQFLIQEFLIPLLQDIRFRLGSRERELFCLHWGPEVIHFHETPLIMAKLREIHVGWPQLPPPPVCWFMFIHDDIPPNFSPKYLLDEIPPAVPLSIQQAPITTIQLNNMVLDKIPRHVRQGIAKNKQWSQQQRDFASNAEQIASVEDLDQWLTGLFETQDAEGRPLPPTPPEKYAQISTDILKGRKLHVQDKNKDLVFHLVPGLHDSRPGLNAAILSKVELLEDEFQHCSEENPLGRYPSTHLSNYNRYGVKSHDVPNDVHPSYFRTIGNKNITQKFAYQSDIMRQDAKGARMRELIFDIVNEVVDDVMRRDLVDETAKLDIVVSELPLNDAPASAPFAGLIININVCTDGHLDEGDFLLCVVVGFGCWKKGGVILHQIRLVVDLVPLDILIFASMRMTHLNLRFSGFRGSLVYATDKELLSWTKDMNGCAGKNFPGVAFTWDDALKIAEEDGEGSEDHEKVQHE